MADRGRRAQQSCKRRAKWSEVYLYRVFGGWIVIAEASGSPRVPIWQLLATASQVRLAGRVRLASGVLSLLAHFLPRGTKVATAGLPQIAASYYAVMVCGVLGNPIGRDFCPPLAPI